MKYSEEKYLSPLIILKLYVKSFVNYFADIALTFSDGFLNSFLFEVTFLFQFFSLISKSVFLTKLKISFLLTKLVYANVYSKIY